MPSTQGTGTVRPATRQVWQELLAAGEDPSVRKVYRRVGGKYGRVAQEYRMLRAEGNTMGESGVEATNNRAERALRFAVMWRKCSSGTESDKGNRWVERTLSLRQTCRQLGQSTFGVWVDAISCSFQGRQPDLAWLY